MDSSFAFLSRIPDQTGYMVISDGAVIKVHNFFGRRGISSLFSSNFIMFCPGFSTFIGSEGVE